MEQEYKDGDHCKFFGAYAKVYCLLDQFGNVFYVGCTTRDFLTRVLQHMSNARQFNGTTNKKKDRIIRNLNYCVTAIVIDTKWVTGDKFKDLVFKATDLEAEWIVRLHKNGHKLCNTNILRVFVRDTKVKNNCQIKS